MKVQVFQQAPYRHLPEGFESSYDSVVTPPYFDLVEPKHMHEAQVWHIDELLHAARMGFDGVSVTEHSQSSYDVAPNPNLVAAVPRTPPKPRVSTWRSTCSVVRSGSLKSRCGWPRSTRCSTASATGA